MNRQRAGGTQAAARRLVNPTMTTMNTQGRMCIGDAICSVLEDEQMKKSVRDQFVQSVPTDEDASMKVGVTALGPHGLTLRRIHHRLRRAESSST